MSQTPSSQHSRFSTISEQAVTLRLGNQSARSTRVRQKTIASEQLVVDGVQQRHVLGAFDRKLVDGVVVDHLWDAVKRLAELPEDEVPASAAASIVTAHDFHVHETTRAPTQQQIKIEQVK